MNPKLERATPLGLCAIGVTTIRLLSGKGGYSLLPAAVLKRSHRVAERFYQTGNTTYAGVKEIAREKTGELPSRKLIYFYVLCLCEYTLHTTCI